MVWDGSPAAHLLDNLRQRREPRQRLVLGLRRPHCEDVYSSAELAERAIDANPSRVVVIIGGRVIADTRDALTLREASYPAVQYIPRRDVDMTALTRSEYIIYCPYRGDASYYSIPAGGDRSLNAVWTYETHLKQWRKSRITLPSTRIVSTRSANRRGLWWLGSRSAQAR